MSADEQVYFDPGHRRERDAAIAVAEAVRGTFLDNSTGLGVSFPIDFLESGAFLTGAVWENDQVVSGTDPTDRDIFDPYPLLWNITVGPRRDGALARGAARIAFQRLVDARLGWPLVLTHNSGELVATFDRDRGVREFPPGTRTDGTHEHIWR